MGLFDSLMKAAGNTVKKEAAKAVVLQVRRIVFPLETERCRLRS